VGLITYMRTDSVRIADEALRDARKFIDDNYGKDYLPPKARFFAKSGRTQDAHEAIRPASLAYRPSDIRKYLGNDEFRLYQLIWNRFVACQMNPAVFDQTTIDITAGSCLFRAQGSVMKFAGFTIVYTEGKDNDDENGIGKTLPEVTEKELLKLLSLTPEQHFTQPPPRFSEATLVKELEEKGIGRPSTYAAILSTIQDREYVRLENGRLFPTELGTLVNEQLVKNFPKILDVEFTAMMENQLDRIEEGTLERLATLKEFYVPFEKDLEKARKQMRNVKKEEIPTDIVCDKCGSPMVIKWGRKGQFIACSNYPKCKNTSNFTEDENGKIVQTETEKTDMVCEKCGKPMVVKEGRFGRFLGCSGYPECKSTAAISLGVSCPEKGCGGDITEKRTKKGKAFFGCSNYPKCKFATWDRPIPEPCPACGAPFLVEKYSRNKGRVKACIDKECGYRQAQE
jgi:DNA topoisomerase-1